MKNTLSRALLQRVPLYIDYLQQIGKDTPSVSSTAIAHALSLGEVQVRKDLNAVSGNGRPRVGYKTQELLGQLQDFLGIHQPQLAVLVGAGKLGSALLEYEGFEAFGVHIAAAFDAVHTGESNNGKPIYPIDRLPAYCQSNHIAIGIITVPAAAAQEVCDKLVENGVSALWNFAPVTLEAPDSVAIVNEKLAISLSMLRRQMLPREENEPLE